MSVPSRIQALELRVLALECKIARMMQDLGPAGRTVPAVTPEAARAALRADLAEVTGLVNSGLADQSYNSP